MKGKYALFTIVLSLVIYMVGCGKSEKVVPPTQANTVSKAVQTVQKSKQEVLNQTKQTEIPKPSTAPITEEKVLFGFERGDEGFGIPDWVEEKPDNASKSLSVSKSFASEGKQSLCLATDFPGKMWSSAIVELEQYLDLSPYRQIMADVYVPAGTPEGLKAKIILTVGENWEWIEMARSFPLVGGEWITVSASIESGSLEWKKTEVTNAFRQDIRKLVVRVESNKTPIYNGPVYIDNIRVGR